MFVRRSRCVACRTQRATDATEEVSVNIIDRRRDGRTTAATLIFISTTSTRKRHVVSCVEGRTAKLRMVDVVDTATGPAWIPDRRVGGGGADMWSDGGRAGGTKTHRHLQGDAVEVI